MKILSYNVQSWDLNERRIKGVIDLIKRHDPDLICLQEITMSWFKIIKKELSDTYGITGRDRYHGDQAQLKRDRERNCVLFKKDKFNMVWSHTYWMGPDVHHPSKFEESVFNRIFTATYLEDKKSRMRFQCISTHLDYSLPEGREKQAEVLASYLRKQKTPILLAGDFNSEPIENAHKMISQILIDISNEFHIDEITYHAYDKFPHERIDFIFRSKHFIAEQYQLIKDEFEGLPPSDHYPVESIVKLEK